MSTRSQRVARSTRKPRPLGPAFQILPPRRPLAMPEQDLGAAPARGPLRGLGDGRSMPRLAIISTTVAVSLIAAAEMARLMRPGVFWPLEAGLVGLFTALFAWMTFAFANAAAGFMLLWRGRDLEPWRPQPVLFTRTALLMPTYNEDPGRVLAAIQAIGEDLNARGVGELYDIFVLSDTRDREIAQEEVTGILRLRLRMAGGERIFYRRRPRNTDRKAGNIADWVTSFGAGYEAMIILDADSLMSADTIVRLTAAMEKDSKVGLIQTLPRIVSAGTLFARLQQFANRFYAPVIAQGQSWWAGPEDNYWGHNAIVRVKAFASCAGLPHITGEGPFSGHIMSHDFVEAALLRRGGWAVRMAPSLSGSYEEAPPSLIDMAVRDRRWCQGNLQHSAVLPARGLHWVHRLHMARGMLAYLTAPLWLAFLLVGGLVWLQAGGEATPRTPAGNGLLLVLTMALLFGPKLMGAALLLRSRAARRTCGGGVRLMLGVALEMTVSTLIAPVLMLMQTRSVLDVLRGRHSGWATQRRDVEAISLAAAWRRHWGATLIGLAWGALAYFIDPALFYWTSPVCVGLALAAPTSALTSRLDVGEGLRRMGLLLTPEEAEPPGVLARAAVLRAGYEAEAAGRGEINRLFHAAVPHYAPAASCPAFVLEAA